MPGLHDEVFIFSGLFFCNQRPDALNLGLLVYLTEVLSSISKILVPAKKFDLQLIPFIQCANHIAIAQLLV